MKKGIGKFIYFIISIILFVDGFYLKYFLTNENLGARFNLNIELLESDITFIFATVILGIGLIFYSIKKNKKSTIKDSTIVFNAILIMPFVFVLILTPILNTYFPDTSDNILTNIVTYTASIGTFTFVAWLIMLLIILIRQTFIILTNTNE